MHIKDTWLLTGERADEYQLVNLQWFLGYRKTGLRLTGIEARLSNGNMLWTSEIEKYYHIDVTEGAILKIVDHYIFVDIQIHGGRQLIVEEVKVSDDKNRAIEIETDLDLQVEKMNKRLSLVGDTEKCICTDGITIYNLLNKIENNATIRTNTVLNNVKINKISVDTTDIDFADLELMTCEQIEFTGNGHLRWLKCINKVIESYRVIVNGSIEIDDAYGIDLFEWRKCKIHRLHKCTLFGSMDKVIDLSEVDYIDNFGITIKVGSIDNKIVLDFKGKYVELEDQFLNLILVGGKHTRVILRSTNAKMIASIREKKWMIPKGVELEGE